MKFFNKNQIVQSYHSFHKKLHRHAFSKKKPDIKLPEKVKLRQENDIINFIAFWFLELLRLEKHSTRYVQVRK